MFLENNKLLQEMPHSIKIAVTVVKYFRSSSQAAGIVVIFKFCTHNFQRGKKTHRQELCFNGS